MSSTLLSRPAPADQAQRIRALDPGQSILVQAPAGSGKTDLLTRRFLRLLAEVAEPGEVIAITFTNAAAAEMRQRILSELEKAASDAEQVSEEVSGASRSGKSAQSKQIPATQGSLFPDPPSLAPPSSVPPDDFAMDVLARRALLHSRRCGWKLLDLPSQLRICTIDSFCRELAALQQPLLSGLGGSLNVAEQPAVLYRRAARHTLERIGQTDPALSRAIESLLLWRDNGWQEMENLLVTMLGQRDRWMHEFVLDRDPDEEALRERLERPFARAVSASLTRLTTLLGQVPGACDEALTLARFACEQTEGKRHRDLAEMAEFPCAPFCGADELEEARRAFVCLGRLLLTGTGTFRKSLTKSDGFPADRKGEKARLVELINRLRAVPGLEAALAQAGTMPPARYTEDDWQIVCACFTLLRHAAGELQVVFAEAGTVDFIEIAQIAQRVLSDEDGMPSDAAIAVADGIHHLLVDEFQDTSRRQHRLLSSIVAAWPERPGRSCFAVGDPMQSIYFFRDADAELFSRVKSAGLEIPDGEPLAFDFVPLRANFRTTPDLVGRLNEVFKQIFATDDGSGIAFSAADASREAKRESAKSLNLHLRFTPQASRTSTEASAQGGLEEDSQATEILKLIREHLPAMEEARARGEKFRIAVLGRTRSALAPVAQALREAAIPFRAVDLEKLSARPEVLDALALARALLNPMDRVAWLGVLRAPWCGLTLEDLHRLTGADDAAIVARPIPDLADERQHLLSEEGRGAVANLLQVLASLPALRESRATASLGTWLQSVWLALGGDLCVDSTGRANLDLLWNCLDSLPAGEQDLLGPALNEALAKLTALPDTEADADHGVQLMTIHKSKGLEFEVVIVPELQATGGRSGTRLLSWLERGLVHPDDSGEITEFLIAPVQSKGDQGGPTKKWVDRAYRERETQEMRRILYVAATRAREELHLFARPACKLDAEGNLTLVEPTGSLLATAWPALEEEVRCRFEEWKRSRNDAAAANEQVIEEIAAAAQSGPFLMPSPPRPTVLRRLRRETSSYTAAIRESQTKPPGSVGPGKPYSRHEGGVASRALGTAVHSLLEQLARLRESGDWDAAREELRRFEPQIAARIRSTGMDARQAADVAAEVLRTALNVSHDPRGQWILSPHPEAASEASWTGTVAGTLRTVRADRIFRAALEPCEEENTCWWIVDYKTAIANDPDLDLARLRTLFAPQLQSYASIVRKLHGDATPIRAGLYYPRMLKLDWWDL